MSSFRLSISAHALCNVGVRHDLSDLKHRGKMWMLRLLLNEDCSKASTVHFYEMVLLYYKIETTIRTLLSLLES